MVDFWQARPPQWQPDCRHTATAANALFRKIHKRLRSCRSYLLWQPWI